MAISRTKHAFLGADLVCVIGGINVGGELLGTFALLSWPKYPITKTVYVKGHYRKDGTYVKGHWR